jgi:prepilin-type N-terminal cleavage/methylation domain-containing protein
MIVFRNNLPVKPGFTLIEALLSVAIMAVVMTPIFILYNNLFQTVGTSQASVERIMYAHNFLVESERAKITKTTLSAEKKITRPATTLRFEHIKVPADSALSKLNNLYLDKVVIEWQDGRTKRTDTLVSAVYEESKPA